MMLTPKEVSKFKKIAKETMSIDLTDAEAEDQGGRLITFFELLIEVDRKNKQKTHEPYKKTQG